MKIVLHLGAHRTATTLLQQILRLNRDALNGQGVVVYGPRACRNGLLDGVVTAPAQASAQEDRLAARSIGRIRLARARHAEAGAQHLILSEENLIGTMAENLRRSCLYPTAQARLSRIAPAFDGSDLTVALAIRSYDAHWTSQMAHRARIGAGVKVGDKLDLLATQSRRWRHLIEDIAAVFPDARILVWTYEAAADSPAALIRAMTAQNIEVPALSLSDPRPNAAIPGVELHQIVCEGAGTANAQSIDPTQSRFQPFPVLHREKLTADYLEDIDWLEAGADGLATYFTLTGDTSGGIDMTRGRPHEFEERRLAGAG